MGQSEQGRSLRCQLGVHTWATCVNAGARWQECRRCGKYRPRLIMANRFPPSGTGDDGGGC